MAASCRRACTPLRRWSIRFSQPVIRFQLALFWSTDPGSHVETGRLSPAAFPLIEPDGGPELSQRDHRETAAGLRRTPRLKLIEFSWSARPGTAARPQRAANDLCRL